MTIADLEAQRAAIPDDSQLPASTTRDELAVIQRQRADLDRRIMRAREAMATIAALAASDVDQQWLNQLNEWRPNLCERLLALPRIIRDPKMLGVQRNLTLSIRCIDFGRGVFEDTGWELENSELGQLMREAGYAPADADPQRHFGGTLPWRGSIKEIEQRLDKAERRRAAAQAQLDEALMDDADRAKRDAESQARRDALNAAPVRKRRGDGSQYDRYPDGRVVEITS